jgi:hypothetical protein
MLMHFPKMQREGIPGHEVNIFFIIGGKRSIFTISLLGRIPDISTRFCLDAGLIGFRFRGSDPRETVYALCLARYPSPKSPGELARVWGTETSIMPMIASHAFFWDATE